MRCATTTSGTLPDHSTKNSEAPAMDTATGTPTIINNRKVPIRIPIRAPWARAPLVQALIGGGVFQRRIPLAPVLHADLHRAHEHHHETGRSEEHTSELQSLMRTTY